MVTPTKSKASSTVDEELQQLKARRYAFIKELTNLVNMAHRLGLHETGHKMHEAEHIISLEIERLYRKEQIERHYHREKGVEK